jgi:hypothetical protein
MNFDPTITDAQRVTFLQALSASDLSLTDWEKDFMSSFAHSTSNNWFTDGRRKSTEAMWRKYGSEVNQLYPGDDVRPRSIPAADPDACEYFVKLDGVQQHCNAPAVWINKNKFRYCEAHGEAVQKDLRRRGGHMELRPFSS